MSDVPDAISLAGAARPPSRADAPAVAADAVDDGHVTPVMAQYLEIKAVNPDSLLFYRMGDFYELFFRDAEIASRALGIVLTKRGKHRGEDIPMCGVPIHRSDEYLQRLIALGHRVAVCEQLEDPAEARKRGAKAVVRRDVVRLVTPGTLTEDTLLDAARANWLVGIARTRGATDMDDQFGLAAIDLSTGAFRVSAADRLTLAAELTRLDPAEIVMADRLGDDETLKPLWRALKAAQTVVPVAFFDAATAADRLAQHFAVASVDAFGAFARAELAAAAGALAYVEKTQVSSRPALDVPRRDAQARAMLIDAATRANLELTRSLGGERRGTLLATIDRTLTGAGARLLAERIASPLMEPALIGSRLDAVAWCVDDPALRARLRAALAAAADMARPLARLALGRGGPRDLDAIRAGLQAARQLADLIDHPALPAELAEARAALHAAPVELAAHLQAALADELPVLRRDGGFVRAGYSRDLDETRLLQSDSRRLIAGLEADYALETGIRSLKIRHNNVLGYHVDLAATHAEKLLSPPLNARFIHRQTLANAVRFSTPELSNLEARIASAAERALGQEQAIFDELLGAVMAARDPIKRAADALAVIDVTAALADLADTEGWVRPIVDDSLTFAITGGRHPVVEAALKVESGAGFVANDCHLTPRVPAGDGRITIVTGPNMGGKSTYLRQNALITVLAQSGSFVPARAAHIGIVDRLFSRVGASDDLARGRSTFMVEMVETAAILNQAGRRALVILDEIGRGTSTFDGLSIAWGTIEHLHEVNRARALFATHYHELTALARRLDRVVNATIKVREWKGDVVFLHEIVPGVADRSYGIQVARLAGLPSAVITRAKAVLKQLEDQDARRPATQMIDDLPLFAALVKPPEPAAPTLPPNAAAVLAELADVQPDDLSPREAQAVLYRLKALLAGSGST